MTTTVIAGTPNPAGGMYYGPLATALPTDSTTALGVGFVNLGIVSSAGLAASKSRDTTNVTDWLGNIVLVLQTAYTETYQVTLIEALKADVMKLVAGDSNVTATPAASGSGNQLAVTNDGSQLPRKAFVFDLLHRSSGATKRIAIPEGQVTAVGDVTYSASDAVGYQVTITAFKDSSGNFSYEYSDDGTVSGA